MSKPIRVGIIGVGWGALVHAPAFRAVPEFELVALCSRNADRVGAAGAKLGIKDVSTDWERFVKRDDLDLIAVSPPVPLHVSISIAALKAGKHVLCEKPMALNAKDARKLYDVGKDSDRATAICFENRWAPHKYTMWQLVEQGFIGNPYFIRVAQAAGYWHPTAHPQSDWMYKRAEGGGYIMGMQSHEIDFTTKLFGEAVAVCADIRTSVKRRAMHDGTMLDVDADDSGNILLRLASGASVVLSSSVVGLHAHQHRFDFFGEKGSIVASDEKIMGAQASDSALKEIPFINRPLKSGADLGTRRSAGAVRAQALMLEDWLPAFEGKPAPKVPSFQDGLRVQQIIDAAHQSSEGGGWIELKR